MIIKTYLFFRSITILSIIIVSALLVLLSHDALLPYLAQKYLKDYGVEYSKLQGSLVDGISITDLNYKDSISAKSISIHYNFLTLLRLTPKVNTLVAESLHVDVDKLPKSNNDTSSFTLFGFKISKLTLKDSEVIFDKKRYQFDIDSKNLIYNGGLHVEKIAISKALIEDNNKTVKFDLNAINIDYDDTLHVKKLTLRNALYQELNTTIKLDLEGEDIKYDDTLHVGKLAINNAVLTDKIHTLKVDLNSSTISYKDSIKAQSLSLNLDYNDDINHSIKAKVTGENIDYKNTIITAKNLALTIDSPYGKAALNGNIVANRLIADTSLTLDDTLANEHLGFLKDFPKSLHLKLEATPEKLSVVTFIDKITFGFDENLSIKNADVNLSYFIEDTYFTADVGYDFSYLGFDAIIKESLLFTTTGAYQSTLNATLIKEPMKLPFKTFSANVAGDTQIMVADINTSTLKLSILGKEYQHFDIQGEGNDVALSFVDGIPNIFKKDVLSFETAAVMELSPLSIVGTIATEDLYSKINGNFEVNTKNSLYRATLNPKQESELFKNYPMQKLTPLELVFFNTKSTDFLNIDAQFLNISLFKNGEILNGWGSVSSSSFDLRGDLNDSNGAKSLTLSANIPSLYTLLDELDLASSIDIPFYDAQVNINSTLKLSDTIEIKSRIDLPWYAFQLDSQTTYAGIDSFIEVKSIDKKISIDSYSIDVLDHQIYSQKDSQISLDKDGNIDIEQLWIYDNLLLTGFINPTKKEGNIEVKSERFTYAGKEGNITAKADISAHFDDNATQSITGNIELIDGVITYMPTRDYSITDEDIIIIQDIKERSQLNRFINIHITSSKPIAYKISNVDLLFTPDITVFQEPKTPLVLLGMVTVNKGKIIGEGKAFALAKSEIYFYGENNFNPYLNLNLHYRTLNDIDIEIFVTNNLDSPVVIFSSNPAMSQNDIMSYILFGQPSSSVFDGSSEGGSKMAASSLLLGTGLKQIFNKASAIKVDTLNILTTKEGSLGYEIGSRINQDFRVVYKNDTISSVIVQYSINKSTRLDVDVRETGQGVSILYVKDYK